MASKKLGNLIKEARTNADLTQEKLARKVDGLTAADISKAERGEKDLTQEQLKQIAKVTGVTQASLLNAAKGTTAKKTAAKTTEKKTAAKTTAKKTATKTTEKKTAATSSVKVTAAEKTLLTLYRDASADAKKAAVYLLKGESTSLLDDIIRNHQNGTDDDSIADKLTDVLGQLLGK